MNNHELIFQLLIIFLVFYFTISYKSILFLSITIDSIFSAINFIKIFILNDITPKELILNLNRLYSIGLIDRYIYYLMLEFIYLIICNLFWLNTISILYYILLISICPNLLNIMCKKYLHKFIIFIRDEKKKFVRIIVCKQLSSVINAISIICIDKNPEINHSELLFLFDDYDKTVGNFIDFLKNFLVISLIHYTRKNSNIVYGKLITYFYNYKTGELIESINLPTAKKRFKNVILNREWKQLLKSDILQSIIYIYSLQEGSKLNYVNIYITKFNYILIKMFTIWTIGTFFEKIYLIPFLSVFFLNYKKSYKTYFKKKRLHKYLFRFIALMLGYITNHYFIISFICEFGYTFTINKVMNTIIQYIYNKSQKMLKICTHFNKYNLFLISIFLYVEIIKYYIAIFFYEYYILNYIFFVLNFDDGYKKFIVTFIIISGSLSGYHEFHLFYILIVSYIFMNIYHYYVNNKNVEISIISKKLSPNIIESYYGRPDININNNIIINNENIELINNTIIPSAPKIIDENENIKNGKNVKIYQKNIDVINNYR